MVIFLFVALAVFFDSFPARGQTILFTTNALAQPFQAPMVWGPRGIYLAGALYDPKGRSGPMASQAVLVLYDATGRQLWSHQVAEPTGVFPFAIARNSAVP